MQGLDVPKVLVFDVNETLLDLAALDPVFVRIFGDGAVRREWFNQTLQSAFVGTITGEYKTLGAIANGALEMVAARRGVRLSDKDRQAVRTGMRSLPAHPDVRPALEDLRRAGFRLATLTNSTAEIGEAQLSAAGLRDLFEQAFSADEAGRLKPAPEPYLLAAQRLGVAPSGMLMVAAHAWDIAGAKHAGCDFAFVARPTQVLDPVGAQPEIVGNDLQEVAERIISRERTSA